MENASVTYLNELKLQLATLQAKQQAVYYEAQAKQQAMYYEVMGKAFGIDQLPPEKRAEYWLRLESLQVMKEMAANANVTVVLISPSICGLIRDLVS